VKFNELIES